MENKTYGGGYTCSKCGQYNRTSSICFCNSLDINNPIITINNNGFYTFFGKDTLENTKDYILLIKSNKEIFKSFLIKALNLNDAELIGNCIFNDVNLNDIDKDVVVIELTNNYKYLTI